jgi:hypothetical protein
MHVAYVAYNMLRSKLNILHYTISITQCNGRYAEGREKEHRQQEQLLSV